MTMRKMIERIIRILWIDDFDLLEVINSTYNFGWGFWLMAHPELFSLGKVYAILDVYGNEFVWGSIFIAIGLGKLIGVALDRYRVRMAFSIASAAIWIFVLVTFIQENPNASLVFFFSMVAGLSIYEYLRHSHKARIRNMIRLEIGSKVKNI